MSLDGLQRIGFAIAARDVAALREFYVTHLGFEVEVEFAEPAYVILALQGVRLSIAEQGHPAGDLPDYTMTAQPEPHLPAAMLILEVADCASQYDRLRAAGVQPASELHRPAWGGARFFITDPEGNLIEFEELA